MQSMEVTLPGGLSDGVNHQNRVSFHPLTGRLEQALIEADRGLSNSGYVTAVLNSVLDRIGDEPTDAATIAGLCVADRQYLMLRLSAMLEGEQQWLKIVCNHCENLFDIDFKRCDLPVKEAGAGFPYLTVQLGRDEIKMRLPTGADQQFIEGQPDEEAIRRLLAACILSVNAQAADKGYVGRLGQSDIEKIDEALDALSPSVCSQLRVCCPECGQEQLAELDHYGLAGINVPLFYDEIHTIASTYHWSEAAILDLPQHRRRKYLDFILRSASVVAEV